MVLAFVVGGVALSFSAERAELGRLVLLLTVPAALMVFRDFARRTSYAELRFSLVLVLDSSIAVLQLAGIAVLAISDRLNAENAFVVIGLACGIPCLGWLIASRKRIAIDFGAAPKDLAKNWFFGRWLFLSGLVREMGLSLYPWLILEYHGASEVGIWAAASGVVALSNPVMLSLYNEAGPRISHDFASGGIEALRKSAFAAFRVCSLTAFAFLILMLVFGEALVVLLYGPEFANLRLLVVFIALTKFLAACRYPLPTSLQVLGRPGLDFAGNLAAFLILVTVGWWAVQSSGAVGAAVASLTATTIQVTVMAIGLKWALRHTAD
jgi:O-antigen/teichoic acid export membrane protein